MSGTSHICLVKILAHLILCELEGLLLINDLIG